MINTIIQFVVGMRLVLTNQPTAEEQTALDEANGGAIAVIVPSTGEWLMPISTGHWYYPYLERLSRNGLKFRVEKEQGYETAERPDLALDKADLAWVDATTLTRVYVYNVPKAAEFNWSIIGLSVKDSKKMAKRLAEVTRLVKASTAKHLSVEVRSPEIQSRNPEFWVKALDGKNAIRMGALPKTIQRDLDTAGHQHVMGRGWTNLPGHGPTLVKGDFVIIHDSEWPWEVDVIAHGENLKDEVTLTSNRPLWTFWEHNPIHATTWDQQTMGNYPKLLPVSRMEADYLAEFAQVEAKLDAGHLPSENLAVDELHGDMEIFPKSEEYVKKATLTQLLRSAGLSPKVFENLVGLEILGFIRSKDAHLNQVEFLANEYPNPLFGFHMKHQVIMRNSFRATCVTDTFMKHFVKVPYPAKRVAHYDSRWGMVWNGEHFARSFELHGTHDNDDTHFFVPVKLWSSDPSTVTMLKKHGVMLDGLEVPKSKDEAKMVLAVFRLPNGAGEYSIMEFDFATWPEQVAFEEDLVETHDLAFSKGWPKPQGMLTPRSMPGLKTSRVYSKKAYTRKDFELDFLAQVENPGFGTMCNTLLAYSMITGGKIPACMPDSLGNIVDATQQGADMATFQQIGYLKDKICSEIESLYKGRNRGTINWYAYYRRGSAFKAAIKSGAIKTRKGEIEAFDEVYANAYRELRASIQTKYSFWMRRAQPVNQAVMSLNFGPNQIAWAKKFVLDLENELDKVEQARANMPIPTSRMQEKAAGAQISKMRQAVIDDAIAKIEGLTRKTRALLCIWHVILKPFCIVSNAKYGHMDRSVCTMGTEKSIAHMIVQAMIDSGLAGQE
jgi:hypothetical protein